MCLALPVRKRRRNHHRSQERPGALLMIRVETAAAAAAVTGIRGWSRRIPNRDFVAHGRCCCSDRYPGVVAEQRYAGRPSLPTLLLQ